MSDEQCPTCGSDDPAKRDAYAFGPQTVQVQVAGVCRDPFHESPCLCGAEGPDEFGNYDQIEHPECPIHGDELLTIDYDAAEARLELLLTKKAAA